ncbi:prolyl oligopeptidase family serine peptidase [Streptomyces sp. NPDC056930]|uniref:prolyl oligopeptidase family serine peptidase n=1 Tax=Streptomyces sp. NPDC056930 TaxID=3345967 RepID=UPI003626C5C9
MPVQATGSITAPPWGGPKRRSHRDDHAPTTGRCPARPPRLWARPAPGKPPRPPAVHTWDATVEHLDAARMTTPMLIVHGGKDYRVPMGQALSLHSDLLRLGVPVRFLCFPTEGHTIGAPNHIRITYETVLNFLDHHVLGHEWRHPAAL